jgi:hypothetical protein
MCTGFLVPFREALFDNTRYGSVVESYSFESALLGPLISIPCSSSSSQRTRIAHASSFRPASRAACLPRTAAYSSCIEQYSRTVRGQLARTLGCDTVCTFFETHPHGRMFQHQNVWWRKCSQSRTYFRFGLRWRHKEHDYRNKYLALVQQVYFASLVLCGFR